MPCRDDWSTMTTDVVSRSTYDTLKKRLDDATRAACTAMTALEYWAEDINDKHALEEPTIACFISKDDKNHANKWFQDHKEADKRRKAELIESAKTKLTAEEKAALGIK